MKAVVSKYDIHSLLLESPMMTSKEVATLAGISYTRARSTLSLMEKQGLVGFQLVDKIRRFYSIEMESGSYEKSFRNQVYDHLMDNEWQKPIEVSRHFKADQRKVRDAISHLFKTGRLIRSDGPPPYLYKSNPNKPYREVRIFTPADSKKTCTKVVSERIRSMGFMAAQLIKE